MKFVGGIGRWLALAAVGLVVFGVDRWDDPLAAHVFAPASITHSPKPKPCASDGILAAALRNDGAGWYAIDDADHAPLNILSIESDTLAITVHFTAPATMLRTFIVAPDESLSLAGVSAGASVEMGSARIVLSRTGLTGPHRISPAFVTTQRWPQSNLWVYGLMDTQC